MVQYCSFSGSQFSEIILPAIFSNQFLLDSYIKFDYLLVRKLLLAECSKDHSLINQLILDHAWQYILVGIEYLPEITLNLYVQELLQTMLSSKQ